MIDVCIKSGCINPVKPGMKLCEFCIARMPINDTVTSNAMEANRRETDVPMSQKYPKYYKVIPEGTESVDVYAICQMFPVQDDTGCINHARKKLLVPGTRTGGKSMYKDIKEARDTLNRWLELHIPSTDSE